MHILKIAAIQLNSTPDRKENFRQVSLFMEKALKAGAQLIALPENFSFMSREGEKLEVMEDIENGEAISFLRDFARKNQVVIVGGSIPMRTKDPQKVTNSCLVISDKGSILATYDKMHLFDISLDTTHDFKESRYVEPGKTPTVFEAFGIKMGLSICYDLRFPELYRHCSSEGAKVLFVPAAFTVPTGKVHWEVLLRARAIENQCFVIAPAQVGLHCEGRESFGHSMIIDPWGDILVKRETNPGFIMAELDFEYLQEIREKLPCLNHIRL